MSERSRGNNEEGPLQKVIGAFEEAFDALGANPQLVDGLNKARTKVIPKLQRFAEGADELIDEVSETPEEEKVIDVEFEEILDERGLK